MALAWRSANTQRIARKARARQPWQPGERLTGARGRKSAHHGAAAGSPVSAAAAAMRRTARRSTRAKGGGATRGVLPMRLPRRRERFRSERQKC
jgi:hypothetical protein